MFCPFGPSSILIMGGDRLDKKFDAVVYNVETSYVEHMPLPDKKDHRMEYASSNQSRLIAPGKIVASFKGYILTYTKDDEQYEELADV